jgi:hypothetical protein
MALWEDVTEAVGGSWASNLLIGAAAVVLAPIVVPAVLAGVRPVAKALIKGGIIVYDKVGELAAETGEQMSDLMSEVRAELSASAAAAAAAHDGTPGPSVSGGESQAEY